MTRTPTKEDGDVIPRGPLAQERADEWEKHAWVVSAHSEKLIKNGGADPAKWPKPSLTTGSLVVIGAGIKCVAQFTVEALGHLKAADQVFYHVADPVTENFIRKIQPNAKDLSVLYDDKKERAQTYIQMAEAMLHPVRHGQNVVTVYYGHPGVFVYASHRAIRIAQKQGLRAKMLPSVSALDCLFADLGVDPSNPGLQVLEATDFLVRQRRILTDGHVVILQVGCVGDKGYRRKGYLMQKFHVLIEHLQSIYGNDFVITHYIASQFPSVRPTIQKFKLSSLLDASFVKKNITAVSTFYISPKDVRPTDPEMARKLGLRSEDLIMKYKPSAEYVHFMAQEKVAAKGKPAKQRIISKYGPREKKSLQMLSTWSVPGAYDATPNTAAADFMISLASDPNKLQKFKTNSAKVLQEVPGILPWQAKYLASGNRSLVRMAIKPSSSSAAMSAAVQLLTNSSFAKAYADEARKYAHDPDADSKLTEFLTLHGFKTKPDAVYQALQDLRQSSLLSWRQTYRTAFGKLEICCKGISDKGQVIWNDEPIQNFTFTSATLSWKADGINQSNAELHFTSQNNLPLFNGKYWKRGDNQPSSDNITGTIENFKSPMSVWRGNYRTVKLAQGSASKAIAGPELSIVFSASNPGGKVDLMGRSLVNFQFNQSKLTWKNGEITFFSSKATASYPSVQKFYGYIWDEGQTKPSRVNYWGTKDATFLQPWSGDYKTYIGPAGKEKDGEELVVKGGLTLETSTIQYGGKVVTNIQFNNPVLSWQEGNNNAEIRFEIFKQGSLGFKGMIWQNGESKPSESNFEGILDKIYLHAWEACYYTKVKENNKIAPGEPLSVTKNGNGYRITYKGEEISNWSYSGSNRQLQWSSEHNSSSGSIRFHVPPPNKGTGLRFFGQVWGKNEKAPSDTNFWGSSVPFPGATEGNTNHLLEELLENIMIIALIEFLKVAWKKFKAWWKARQEGDPPKEQEKLKEEYEDADKNVEQQEQGVNSQEEKVNELDPEADPSPEPPIEPDAAPEPPANEVVDTDTDTTDTDTTDTDTTDVDTDVDVDVDVEIVVCSLM